jgi:hypothetical protein
MNHPLITQTIAADQVRERQERAARERIARSVRRGNGPPACDCPASPADLPPPDHAKERLHERRTVEGMCRSVKTPRMQIAE